jgi:hypothetical protein
MYFLVHDFADLVLRRPYEVLNSTQLCRTFTAKQPLQYNVLDGKQLCRRFGAGQSLDSADTHNFALLGCYGTYDK